MAVRSTPLSNRIPPLPSIPVESVLYRAEFDSSLVTVESLLPKTGYITDGRDFVILTHKNGALRLPVKDMKALLREALEVMEVLK